MRCQEVEFLYEAYALNALSSEEAGHVEQHLAGCRECRQRLADYDDTVARMAYALPPLEAPKHVKSQVMAALATESRTGTSPPLGGWFSRLRPPRLLPALVAVQAAVLVVLVGVAIFQDTQRVRISTDHAMLEQALVLMLAGGQNSKMLHATAQAPEGSWGRVYTRSDMDVVLVLVADTPTPPPETEYRFWFKQGEEFIQGGVVQILEEGAGRGWLVVPKPTHYDAVVITIDPKGSPMNEPQGPTMLQASYS